MKNAKFLEKVWEVVSALEELVETLTTEIENIRS